MANTYKKGCFDFQVSLPNGSFFMSCSLVLGYEFIDVVGCGSEKAGNQLVGHQTVWSRELKTGDASGILMIFRKGFRIERNLGTCLNEFH